MTEIFSRPEVVAHRPDPTPDTPIQSATRLARDLAHWKLHGFGRWAIEAGPTLIGFGGVTMGQGFEGLNLSYHLDPSVWGRGYATELVEETMAFAFGTLRARRVVGLVRSANMGSRRVLEKTGFVFEQEVPLSGAPTRLYARMSDP